MPKNKSNINRNSIEFSSKYKEICHKIRDFIPTKKIQFKYNASTDLLEVLFKKEKSVISILKDNTWEEINIDNDCSICCNKIINKTGCPKCSTSWCVECYIDLFMTGEGIIKCPFCRYIPDVCRHMNETEIEIGIQQIRNKINRM